MNNSINHGTVNLLTDVQPLGKKEESLHIVILNEYY